MMNLPAWIAWRYLRAPKSHGAVSAIAIISVVGVAVATAAIVCVLSVFNGFHSILSDKLDILAADVVASPARGKTFNNADSIASVIAGVEGVKMVMPTVTDNALVIVDGREMPVTLRGVDCRKFALITSIDSIMLGGTRMADMGDDEVTVSIGVASQLGIYGNDAAMLLFAPKREGRVNMANPVESFVVDSVQVADVFQAMQSDYDEKTIICDIATARNLFQYTDEATGFEISAKSGADLDKVAAGVTEALGESAVVKDRIQQQQVNFRMVEIEKWVTFLLLIFILVIASFNIISTMCMLIIEKERQLSTLSSLGMSRRRVGHTFLWESLFVSMSGGLSGIVLGVGLSLAQEHFGLIKLGGDPSQLVIQAYPVVVDPMDILISLIPIAVIGVATAWIASAFARSRM